MAEDPRPRAIKAAAGSKDPESEDPVEEVRYPREQLVEGGVAFLNTQPMFVAGALQAKPNQKTFTTAEAEELVRDYLAREVPPDAGVAR